ncbi:putative ionotropic glutamate receptor [Helianthus annuus]|nr:putative ionotropic glutamate receptor [Helianthus annuus]
MKFDAVVAGDVAIRSSRLDYLDFTQPYNESGDKLHSNFSRMVVVVWLFVALIITQSYTASFTSMLTAQRWKKSRNLLNKNLLDHKVVPSDQTNHTTRATISRLSARSLAASSTSPNRACPWKARSGPASAMAVDSDDSSEDESSAQIPKTVSQTKPIPRSVGYGAFLATSLYMPSHAKGLVRVYAYRNLLQV